MSNFKPRRRSRGSFDQNIGVPGVVYILKNVGFADNYWKIGSTRYSGQKRAQELNDEAGTAIPATYTCVFQEEVSDCGTAERLVHARLRQHRRGRHGRRYGRDWGQEFFEVDFEVAKETVRRACEEVNARPKPELPAETPSMGSSGPIYGPLSAEPGAGEPWSRNPVVDQVPSWMAQPKRQQDAHGPWPTIAIIAAVIIGYVMTGGGTSKQGVAQANVPVRQQRQESQAHAPSGMRQMPVQNAIPVEESPATRPRSQPFPSGGSVMYAQGAPEPSSLVASLKVYAPTSGMKRQVVMLARAEDNTLFAQVYLDANDVVEMGLPEGEFRALVASGVEWFGAGELFGPNHPLAQLGEAFRVTRGARLKLDVPDSPGL